MSELNEILARYRSQHADEDHDKLSAAVETLAWLTHELEAKRVSVARLKRLLFGQQSEKTADVLGADSKEESAADQPPTANDAAGSDAADGNSDAADGNSDAADGKKKRKGHGRNGADRYKGADRVEVSHPSLKPGAVCPECDEGKVYRYEPSRLVRIRGQAPLRATVYELEKLRCNLCGVIFAAEAPEEIGEEKYDATSASMIALLKYGSGLPFNRLERLEGSLGVPLPAATQWDIVHGAAESIRAPYEELIRQAAQGEVLHNDDTTMRILEHMGKRWRKKHAGSKGKRRKGKSKERTGTFTSGIVSVAEGREIVLFFTGRNHAGENLSEVLAQRAKELAEPIQMCDALSRNMPAELRVIVANCLAHARRQFVDVAESFPEEVERVLVTLRRVYRADALARKYLHSAERRFELHRRRSRPRMVELLWEFRRQQRARTIEPNSPLGDALKYLRKHWRKLTRFYRTPGAPLDNNICERALKRAILHRKNSMFYKSERGARVGDRFMSLIHTAERCGENPFDYLCALQRHSEQLQDDPSAWMPWSYRAALERASDSAGS